MYFHYLQINNACFHYLIIKSYTLVAIQTNNLIIPSKVIMLQPKGISSTLFLTRLQKQPHLQGR